MEHPFLRNEMLWGPEAQARLRSAHVLLLGLGGVAASIYVSDLFVSSLLGVFAFSSFWTIKEVFDQEKRVRKGWFPKNPRRTYKF